MTSLADISTNEKNAESDAEDNWTPGRLIDELYLQLMRVREKDGSTKRKYLEEARYLMYRIPAYRPTPPFNVNVIDLTSKLRQELERLDDESLDSVMKEAIGRIFENINERYFLLSVKTLLKWELRE